MNHYRVETMDFLASKIGHVVEIAYDPKASQKEAYIRALVRLNIANPAIEIKPLNLPSGGRVIIEFEYEKLRKRCFHCHRLTHERPSCPFVTKPKGVQERRDTGDKLKSQTKQLVLVSNPQPQPLRTVPSEPQLRAPPGFPPLFPELQDEERNAALLYISHSDATERQARIMRVQQSLAPGYVEPTVVRPIISHDLNKGKGHVFSFQENDRPFKRSSIASEAPGSYERTLRQTNSNSQCGSSDLDASSASSPSCPTVFHMGSAPENPSPGNKNVVRKSRRRPQRWKRITKLQPPSVSAPAEVVLADGLQDADHGVLPRNNTSISKRKASSTAEEQLIKSSKPTQSSVASGLKPLPSQ